MKKKYRIKFIILILTSIIFLILACLSYYQSRTSLNAFVVIAFTLSIILQLVFPRYYSNIKDNFSNTEETNVQKK